MEKMKALIINPDPASRARLKQALHTEEQQGLLRFSAIHALSSTTDGLTHLLDDPDFDLVLLSFSLGRDAVCDFLAKLEGQVETAIIIVLQPSMQDQVTVAQTLIAGTHGILCEPYSVAGLREIADIAAQVRKEKRDKQLLGATPLLVDALLGQVDRKAENLRKGGTAKEFDDRTKSLVEHVLTQLQERGVSVFYNRVFAATEQAHPFAQRYSGPSELLKKKFEAEEKSPHSATETNSVRVIRR